MESRGVKGRPKTALHNPLRYITARAESVSWASQYRLMRERFRMAKSLYRRDLKAHYGCVNAIEFSNDGLFIVSGGDDRRVLLWNVEKALSDIGEPAVMKGEHNSNIFCLAVNSNNTRLYSGGNDEQVAVHDIVSGQTLDVFLHEEAVYGLSADPVNDNVFASACDDGRILIYDTRGPASTEPFVLASYTSSMHAVMYNPVEPRLLASANAKEGVGLWDIRKPRSCVLRYGGRFLQQSCMSVRINNRGTHLVALRRRLPPVLYELGSTHPLCDMDHDGYYNSCTMKSCCFAGPQDEYVLSGSDDFNLYMWKIPDDLSQRVYVKEAHMILRGHRSIVNQVRYNQHRGLIISSGVEKIIKVWSPFNLNNGNGGVSPRWESSFVERPVYTHEEYINLVLRSGLVMSHDYSSQSKEEDPRMMAFFDSLVQRELEYWSSDEDLSSNEMELYDSILQATRRSQQLQDLEGDDEDYRVQPHVGDGDASDSSDNSEFSPFTLAFASVMAAQETDASLSRVLDAHEESERLNAVHEGSSDGLNPRSKRKSISEIIAQNRKEVMRAAEMRHKSMRSSQDLHADILSSTSSESDSDDENPSPSVRSDLDIGHVLNKRRAQQQRVAYQLKRLQALRTRLVTSDTDNSADEAVPMRKRPRLASSSSREECVQETRQSACDMATEAPAFMKTFDFTSSLFTMNTKGKGCYEHEAGPYLQKTDGPSLSGHPTVLSLSSSYAPSQPSTSGGCAGHCHSSHENSSSSATARRCSNENHHKEESCGQQDCQQEGGSESQHRESASVSGRMPDQPERSDGEALQPDGEASQPVWTEFKRLRKRLQRAQRYYRQHSNNGDSSDDD